MYLIEKKTEPRSLTTERESHKDRLPERDFDVWSHLTAGTKADIKRCLVEEQRGVCCYCTARITSENCRVEHWEPQSVEPEKRLTWSNLLAACPGGEGDPRNHHCDVLKAARRVTVDPKRKGHVGSIVYSNSGRISSTQSAIQKDLDELLGLNIETLARARKAALSSFLKTWAKKRELLDQKKKNRLAVKVRGLIQRNPAPQFYQIILFYLTKSRN